MRRERCCDDGSDSYPWVGYQHSIYPSWACLALQSRVNEVVASQGCQGLPIGLSSHRSIDLMRCSPALLAGTRLVLGLPAHGPDEARQFPGDGHADLVLLDSASIQGRHAPAQAQLRLPGDGLHGFGGALLAGVDVLADARGKAIVPGRLRQQLPGVRVARLGDAAARGLVATGLFRGHQAEVTHELARRAKALEV